MFPFAGILGGPRASPPAKHRNHRETDGDEEGDPKIEGKYWLLVSLLHFGII